MSMDDLIGGIQILFGSESMTQRDMEAAARMVGEIKEAKGERGLNILRAMANGELAADEGYEALFAQLH